jgi:seryl-tRNA synthetase
VTTFIKAEEQNYSLYNYVNTLNQETDSLEESNREIKEEIERYLAREKMNEKEKEQLINDLKDEVNEIMR